MPKNWLVSDKISEEFVARFPQYDQVTLQLLANRGITEAAEIERFLDSGYGKYAHDPFLFRDMGRAVELIIAVIKRQEKILVYGDYDADGVTAATILTETLKTLKAEAEVYIPDRVSEGYGLNRQAIKESVERGVKLIITVDNGIRSKEEVAYARSLGAAVVVTDHHVAPETASELPDCPLVDPIVPSEPYPFKFLAGAGVAAKLATALIRRSNLEEADKTRLEERILDLVAIGTVADCVRLQGENRVLVKKGLEVLNKTKRPGLLELIRAAKINGEKRLDAWNIGFQIAPRLNAAGRMDHANTAFELLNTADKAEAQVLARDLNEKNIDRQRETEAISKEIESDPRLDRAGSAIIAVSPSVSGIGAAWNEGVIGLVAGRLAEKYYRPAIVITGDEHEMKASGRSVPGFDLIEAIEKSAKFLKKYGGHASACGFSLAGRNNLDGFIATFTEVASSELTGRDLRPVLKIELEIDFERVDEVLVETVERFAPFGEENERPVFLSRNLTIVDIVHMGISGQHVKLRVKSDRSGVKSALGFGQAEAWQNLRIGDRIDLVYYPEINEFNGKREIQVKIVDIKTHNT